MLATTEIARICGDEEKPALEGKNEPQCWRFDLRIPDGVLKNGAKRYGIESLTFDRLNVPKEIEQNNSTGGEAKRHRHIEHGPLASKHAGLGDRLNVVGHRFDSGIRASPEGVSK